MPVELADLACRVEERCVLQGDFTLSSGKPSKYFYDGKRALLAADLRVPLAAAMLERASAVDYEMIGGVAIGSVLISEHMSMLASQRDERLIDTFYVIDQRKKSGTRERVFQAFSPNGHDGPQATLTPGVKVLVVDDVVTTGKSLKEPLDAIERIGAEVAAVSVIVDRLDPEADWLRAKYQFLPLFEADDLGHLVVARDRVSA
ncbi:MAG: phosphoribosyltransferase family protein [Chloroflexi bacterium]|nr:phosphoribosyltransferase family protein [Chloroflexota bacterium]